MTRLDTIKRFVRRPLEKYGLLRRPPGRVRKPASTSGCNILTVAYLPDQSGLFAEVLTRGPIVYDIYQECWVAVQYSAVAQALRNEDWFNNEYSANFDPFLAGSTGSEHAQFRRAVQQAATWFDRYAIENFAVGWMNEFCLYAQLSGKFDAVNDLGVPLPRAFTIELLGLNEAEASQIINVLRQKRTQMNEVLQPVGREILSIIKARRRSPVKRTGMLDSLMASEPAERLNDEQIMSLTRHIWFAGTITLSGLLPACVVRLASDPLTANELRESPEKISCFVSEMLRLESITQFVPRKCVRNVRLGGQQMYPGDLILLHLGAANRDPAMFESPDTLLLDRLPHKHLAFGFGSHVCLGRIIATTIAETCIRRILHNLSGLRPTLPGFSPRYEKSIGFRALELFSLSVDARN